MVLDHADVFEMLMRVICPTGFPCEKGAGLFLCAIARVCRTWRDGVAYRLTRCLGLGRHRRLAMFDVLPEAPVCAADLPAYYARLKRIRDHFLVYLTGGVWLELQMDCTHRNVVVQAFAATTSGSKKKRSGAGMLSYCNVVESFHATRGVLKKRITCTDKLGPPRVEQREFVGQVSGPLILGVLLDKQALGPPLEPNNYGGVWIFPSVDVGPPCSPERTAWVNPRRWRGTIEVPDQNYADARGNVVFSCLHHTTTRIPRNPIAAVVPSVDIHFLPRPYWSDRKLRMLLSLMQEFPSLKGARPDPTTVGGIELPQSAEQRAAFGTASAAFGEKDMALVCGFNRPFHYDGHADGWRKLLKDDQPHLDWLVEGRGYRRRDWSTGVDAAANSSSQICPSMHVWAVCGPTLQQMRDLMSALEACGHLLIATNLTRVGPFQFKEQQFFSTNELEAMTAYVRTGP